MTICQEQGTKMNKIYYDFLHNKAANTALPESDHDSEDEQAHSGKGIDTGINVSMAATETTQVGQME